ncbi:MAG: hypothetical protein H0Z19_08860 [Archaeoglobus sp.]|uniref:hypothetical protein n=1 Tax=Archaeoglobus sp. TaxID=1872626 RepID=UPI001D6A3DB2|nr:hypothetical protein [Archaeoglobus sp.]MBO8180566.1 hypothetical protein [Archaeoglobus sp.]
MNKEMLGSLIIVLFGSLLLIVTLIQFNSSPSVHKTIYFCCGSLFGIGMSLLSFKAEETRKVGPKRGLKALIKLVLIFVILLLPIYVAPFYYVYLYDNITWLLLYISGTLINGGIAMLILTWRRREVLKLTNEFKLTPKLFIVTSTSIMLLTTGCAVMYAFHSTFFTILGIISIFFGFVFLVYAVKIILLVRTAIL